MSPLPPLLERLAARAPRGIVLGLERVERALSRLGDPHLGTPTLHVAGTNGKGSTCAMTEALLRAAGLRTGLTTSPHLVRFAERVRIDGAPIGDEAFAAALERVLPLPEELTFFESLTLAAFVAFRDARLDAVVLETGLGGRLDATNVCAPTGTAITSIDRDHAALLGETLEAIAAEKAGIAKAGVPLVLGRIAPAPRDVILARAGAVGAVPIVRLGAELLVSPGSPARVSLPALGDRGALSLPIEPSLAGAHQLDNAAVACALARTLVSDAALAAAAPALSRVAWPGRLERLERDGRVILLDGAHNEEGARALAAALEALGHRGVTLVFAAMDDKPVEGMLAALLPAAARAVLTTVELEGAGTRASRRPASLARLRGAADAVTPSPPVLAATSPEDAVGVALGAAPPGGTVVVCGSLYLIGRARAALLGLTPDPSLGL